MFKQHCLHATFQSTIAQVSLFSSTNMLAVNSRVKAHR